MAYFVSHLYFLYKFVKLTNMPIELNAKIREIFGKKVKTLRKKGILPAVL